MDYTQRIGMNRQSVTGVAPMGGNQTVGAQFSTGLNVGGSATGPALVLVGLVAFLVLDYVWTRGQQGGR
jgi:hypothetical protein